MFVLNYRYKIDNCQAGISIPLLLLRRLQSLNSSAESSFRWSSVPSAQLCTTAPFLVQHLETTTEALWRGSGWVTVQFLALFSISIISFGNLYLLGFLKAFSVGLSAIKNQIFPLAYPKTDLRLIGAYLLVWPSKSPGFLFSSLLIMMHTCEAYRSWRTKPGLPQ